jgi:hypothetical protein
LNREPISQVESAPSHRRKDGPLSQGSELLTRTGCGWGDFRFTRLSAQGRIARGRGVSVRLRVRPITRGEDGDPLDIPVLMDSPAFPGCIVPSRVVGVVEAEQTEDGNTERNDRLIAVAANRQCTGPFASCAMLRATSST